MKIWVRFICWGDNNIVAINILENLGKNWLKIEKKVEKVTKNQLKSREYRKLPEYRQKCPEKSPKSRSVEKKPKVDEIESEGWLNECFYLKYGVFEKILLISAHSMLRQTFFDEFWPFSGIFRHFPGISGIYRQYSRIFRHFPGFSGIFRQFPLVYPYFGYKTSWDSNNLH